MTKTVEDVKAEFAARGETMREWAEKRGYKPSLVYAVINGRNKCKWGAGHLVAVELGLKAMPVEQATH